MELSLDTLEAGGVDGRADVDGGRQEADLERHEEFLREGPIPRVVGVVGVPGDEEVVGAFFSVGRDGRCLAREWGPRRVRRVAIFLLALASVEAERRRRRIRVDGLVFLEGRRVEFLVVGEQLSARCETDQASEGGFAEEVLHRAVLGSGL